jgi:hypothetical protein
VPGNLLAELVDDNRPTNKGRYERKSFGGVEQHGHARGLADLQHLGYAVVFPCRLNHGRLRGDSYLQAVDGGRDQEFGPA